MVMQTRMAESLGVNNTNETDSSVQLTPTTLKSITQLFESDNCLQNIQRLDEGEDLQTNKSKSSSIKSMNSKGAWGNLDSKSWQGGLTTVVSPSKCIPHIGILINDKEEQDEVEMASEDIENHEGKHLLRTSNMRTRRSIRLNSSRAAAANVVASKPVKKSPAKRSGRKPASRRLSEESEDLDPEESKRLTIRRQRNKEAAARCRKRRVDLTNSLMQQVDAQEAKKRSLEDEIAALRQQKDELEFILQAHSTHCKLNVQQIMMQQPMQCEPQNLVVAVKSEPVLVEPANAPFVIVQSEGDEASKPKRPVSLSLASSGPSNVSGAVTVVPVTTSMPLETPSSSFPSLSFDCVTTGLTPCAPAITSIVTPTLNTPVNNCASQQRLSSESSSNDNSPDYVTL